MLKQNKHAEIKLFCSFSCFFRADETYHHVKITDLDQVKLVINGGQFHASEGKVGCLAAV